MSAAAKSSSVSNGAQELLDVIGDDPLFVPVSKGKAKKAFWVYSGGDEQPANAYVQKYVAELWSAKLLKKISVDAAVEFKPEGKAHRLVPA